MDNTIKDLSVRQEAITNFKQDVIVVAGAGTGDIAHRVLTLANADFLDGLNVVGVVAVHDLDIEPFALHEIADARHKILVAAIFDQDDRLLAERSGSTCEILL